MAGDQPNPSPKPRATSLPDAIGGYAITRVIGTGGMAIVYAALQKSPKRTVALKVMKTGINADTALRRFRREIEILGRLRHPYIAQVFDAGLHDEHPGVPDSAVPYFVMEYVPGARTIVEYATAQELNTTDRLKLFVKVCAAVEHGHHNKVIHRDLKPSNILIDERGDPKIIDFGVARAMDPGITSQTVHTEAGRLIGTVQYMSPEQVNTAITDIDARADVYSLGVVLYRLLTDHQPHSFASLPLHEAARMIREDPPVRPHALQARTQGRSRNHHPQGPGQGSQTPVSHRGQSRPRPAALPGRQAHPRPTGEDDLPPASVRPPAPCTAHRGGGDVGDHGHRVGHRDHRQQSIAPRDRRCCQPRCPDDGRCRFAQGVTGITTVEPPGDRRADCTSRRRGFARSTHRGRTGSLSHLVGSAVAAGTGAPLRSRRASDPPRRQRRRHDAGQCRCRQRNPHQQHRRGRRGAHHQAFRSRHQPRHQPRWLAPRVHAR
jgi:hypothetical protein